MRTIIVNITKNKFVPIVFVVLIICAFVLTNSNKTNTNRPNYEIEQYKKYYEEYVNELVYVSVDGFEESFQRYKIYQNGLPQDNSWMAIDSIDRLLQDKYEFEAFKIDDIYTFNSSINNLHVGKYLYTDIIDEITSLFPENVEFIINLEVKNLYRNDPIVEDDAHAIQKYLLSSNFNGYVILRILVDENELTINSIPTIKHKINELMDLKWSQYTGLEEKRLRFDVSSNLNSFNELTLDEYFNPNKK